MEKLKIKNKEMKGFEISKLNSVVADDDLEKNQKKKILKRGSIYVIFIMIIESFCNIKFHSL